MKLLMAAALLFLCASLVTGCGGSSGKGVYVVSPTGGGARKVFSGCADSFAVSADGRTIAVDGRDGLDVIDLRDDRTHLVAKNADEYALSPDGSEVAWGYNPFGGFGKGLWVAGSMGVPKPRRIWNGQLRSLAWSPDGREIALSSVARLGSNARVALVRPDRTGLTYLTRPLAEGFLVSTIRWFPDSKQLTFVESGNSRGPVSLWRVRAAGKGLRRVVTEPAYSWPPTDTIDAISPDGTRIAYSVELNHSGPYGTDPNGGEFFVVNADGSGKKYLGHGAVGSWSPNGTQLAYTSDNLYVMNADGTGRRKIATNADYSQWSSNGQLAYDRTPFSCSS